METLKRTVIAAFSALFSWLGVLAVPLFLLIGMNLLDYFTGIYAAGYRGESVSSHRGIHGIAKKICMWLLVAIGVFLDLLLHTAATTAGVHVHLTFLVGSLAAVWLACNEMISVLENIADIGVALPPFLMRIVLKLKRGAEEKAEEKAKETGGKQVETWEKQGEKQGKTRGKTGEKPVETVEHTGGFTREGAPSKEEAVANCEQNTALQSAPSEEETTWHRN